MKSLYSSKVKTTIQLEKSLLEDIDRCNPFSTRREFLDQACKAYLQELKRRQINDKLEAACAEAAAEDTAVNEEWEQITLEAWK